MFEVVNLEEKLSKAEYKRRTPLLQARLWELQRVGWEHAVPTILVFEGWDAAGKGDCVRKLTERLEPRGFELHRVTDNPRTHELAMPWMWPFWNDIPPRGKIAIFDRSWNRRAVLFRIERPEAEMEWRRSLRDINDFERWLTDDGYLVVKLFLHISHDEQLRRYARWKKDPGRSWKALEGVWRKPDRYDEILAASEDLLQNTESGYSPWHLIPSTDRRWARVEVFETLIARLESGFAERGIDLPEPSPTTADRDGEE